MSEGTKIEPSPLGGNVPGTETRKPYTAPCLRRLGSVRDLTLGSPTGCQPETPKGRTMGM